MPDNFHAKPKPWATIKHGLLQYLELFLGKLGRPGRSVFAVDGFAGSGRLEDDSEGSPLKAARIASDPRQPSRRGILKCINCEKKQAVFDRLQAATREYVDAGIVQNLRGEFDEKLPEILRLIGDSPALFFIDPFGTQGAELSTLKAIAHRARGREVLVRFDDTRLKRLIRLATNHLGSLDLTQRRIAESLAARVAEFVTEADMTAALALLDVNERVGSRDVLIDAYCRIVLAQTEFKHAIYYPLRNPKTGGHRYFIVHFCSHPDGYVYMADFMAKAERAFVRQQSDLLFGHADQMEFPTIREQEDDQVHEERKAHVLTHLPAIRAANNWHGCNVEARRVFEAIVDEFGWTVLKTEYHAALREWKKQGAARFENLEDGTAIQFPR